MSVISEKSILEKIEELKGQRDAYIAEANQNVAALNGAIQALEGLLAPPAPPAKPAPPAEKAGKQAKASKS